MEAPTPPSERNSQRNDVHVPLLGRIPDGPRKHILAVIGEFVGTVLFLLFAFAGTQVAQLDTSIPQLQGTVLGATNKVGTPANTSQLTFIALSFGFSLAVTAWVFFRISGSLFNPAITLAMCLIGAMPWIRGIFISITQIVAGLVAAALTSALFPGPLNVKTKLGGGTSIAQGLFIEMFMTALLVLTVLLLAAERHKGTFLAPIGIGLSLFVAEIAGLYFTGASLNPARSFGPCVVLHSFEGYHWIYWLGPLLGSLLAAAFYKFLKVLDYETVNGDQDLSKAEIKNERTRDLESGQRSLQ